MRHLDRPHARIGHEGFDLSALANISKYKLGRKRSGSLAKWAPQCAAQHYALPFSVIARVDTCFHVGYIAGNDFNFGRHIYDLTQRREGATDANSSFVLCAFAPWRENLFFVVKVKCRIAGKRAL